MRLLAWCDAANAPTGFGRSSNHILSALHAAGYEITQLAVNANERTVQDAPWRVFLPDRPDDPYGVSRLKAAIAAGPYDLFWATFDPECPWYYNLDGKPTIQHLVELKQANPGFRMAGWFPVDGGPLSDAEMNVVVGGLFDAPVTMSPHVYDLVEWTLRLRGSKPDRAAIEKRLRMIPHGVDLSRYRIPTEEERREAKRSLGFNPDAFVVLQLERNQQRKQNYLGLDVMEQLLSRGGLTGKVTLYQHMLPDEESTNCGLGYNLPDLAWRYGLQPGRDVLWAPGWISESEMPTKVYACADAFLSTSCGEGFQYPAWEALACGVPLVVPDDSARAAWFKHAPNVHLYKSTDRRLVLRGGYKRRMGQAHTDDAARILRKMIEGKRATDGAREAGRSWVARTASVEDVQRKWVELMDEQKRALLADRAPLRIAAATDEFDVSASLSECQTPGLGDMLLAKPALDALRRAGKRVVLRVPRSHYEIARLADLADAYDALRIPAELAGRSADTPAPRYKAAQSVDLSSLYLPKPHDRWHDAAQNRADLFAGLLGAEHLQPVSAAVDPIVRQQATARFLESFGVEPGQCVAICPESGDPRRSMPRGHVEGLIGRVQAQGHVPLLLGHTAMGIRKVGTIDLSGACDVVTAAVLLGMVRAAICVDSAPMHLAALQGTPLVAVLPTVTRDARLRYYAGKIAALHWGDADGDERKREPRWPQPHLVINQLHEVLK